MRTIGVIMNGVTGRMGTNQHLIRSLLAMRERGGVRLASGEALVPEPLLVGRDATKLRALAQAHGIAHWTTDLDEALADARYPIYFDALVTGARGAAVRSAIAAGKHVYCEKPLAADLATAIALMRLAESSPAKHGIVQDKLFLPGLLKLRRLVDGGFFGRLLSVRIEFGYWVFEGDWQAPQRPSWNYRADQGGGIVQDMFCHWRYVLDHLFGAVKAVSCFGVTDIPERVDEHGRPYRASADDAAYGTLLLEGDVVAQVNSSWTTRVYRDDLLQIQVDGTEGSAVAGLRQCRIQHRGATPRAIWNPDIPQPHDFRADWVEVPDNAVFDNAFLVQWERFLRHVVDDEPFPWTFREGVKGVQLAELALQSWRERRWVNVPAIPA